MPKPRTNELVQGRYFCWRLGQRTGMFYADGRSNKIVLGRYSLTATTRDEAIANLSRLDLVKAVEHGLAEAAALNAADDLSISLEAGRDLYLASIRGARITPFFRTQYRFGGNAVPARDWHSSGTVTCAKQKPRRK